MTNNFFAIVEDGSVRRISLTQKVSSSVKSTFLKNHDLFLGDDIEQVEFTGAYTTDSDQVSYVKMDLPAELNDVAKNAIGIPILDLDNENIKTLFWYEDGFYYFQNFDKRKLLKNRNVITYNRKTYSGLDKNGFIVDNQVHAIYHAKKFFFKSYVNGTRVFSLTEYFNEATNDELKKFTKNKKVAIDESWLLANSNSIIRKQITLLEKTGVLNKANSKKIKKSANAFKLTIELDDTDRIIFPEDKKLCRDILSFLNERYYIGLITGRKYQTNSNRPAE